MLRRTLFLLTIALAGRWLPAWTAPAAAFPRGEARFWVEERQQPYGPYGVVRDWEGTVLHSDGNLFPVNFGAWSWSADRSEQGEELRLEARDLPTVLGRLTARAGDLDDVDRIDDPLLREFRPGLLYRGGSGAWGLGRFRLEGRGGRLTERRGPGGTGVVETSSRISGARLSFDGRGAGLLEAAWDQQVDEAGDPLRRDVGTLSIHRHDARGWGWVGEARVSRIANESRNGTSLLGGVKFAGTRVLASGHLRRLTPEFRDAGLYQLSHVGEWGGRFQLDGHPGARVYAGLSFDWARDLSEASRMAGPEERLEARAHVSTPLVASFDFLLDGRYRDRTTVDPESLLVDQGSWSGRGEIGWHHGPSSIVAGYTRGLFRNRVDVGEDWHEDRWSLRGGHTLHRSLTVALLGDLVERRLPDGTWTSRERGVNLQLDWQPGGDRRIWLQAGRERQEANDEDFELDQWDLGGGFEAPLPGRLTLVGEAFAFVRAGARDPEQARWSLRLARDIHFGGGRLNEDESLPEFGRVTGHVFEDANGNGRYDRNEPGLAGLTVRLASGREARTDPDGRYEIRQAAAGPEWVDLNLTHLPTRYLRPAEGRVAVDLRAGRDARVDFPLRRGGAVEGRVTIPTPDGADAGVPGVLIQVVGGHQDVFTDAQGGWRIGDLPPGPVTVSLVAWSLPKETGIDGDAEAAAMVRPGEVTPVATFHLTAVEPKTLQHYRPKKR